nr:unnamed protein product [Callosobruchus analis]
MHMLVHPGTKSDLGTCKYCNESFRGKTSLDNHVIKKHPDFITSIKRKIHECSQCNYKTPRKKAMERHTSTHTGAVFKVLICEHCNATFKWEETLDSHIFKNHPDLIASIKRKILECLHCTYKTTFKNTLRKHMIRHSNRKTHECTQCDYKTIKKQYLTKHMLKHAGIVFKPSVCEHCNASFNSKQTLDSHILRDHPDFVESIKSKIHECSKCSYKTIRKSTLTKHMLTHPSSDSDLIRCQHCNASFKRTVNLDNHVLRKHPDFEASIERKIHECEQCGYKSTLKSIITRHKLTHSKTDNVLLTVPCLHCKAAFKTKKNRDNHILKKHPDFVASVTRKNYECSSCTYRTVYKSNFSQHVRTHSRVQHVILLNATCLQCEAIFKTKKIRDEHILKQHPDFGALVTRKKYECSSCTFKTISKCNFDRHMRTHSGGRHISNSNLKKAVPTIACLHCSSKFKTELLRDHHIIRRHPNFEASVRNKIYACSDCTFKSVYKHHFNQHMGIHSRGQLFTGQHCSSTSKSRYALDDHVVKKHPELIDSNNKKIYECSYCTYKTMIEHNFNVHVSIHLGGQSETCQLCGETF